MDLRTVAMRHRVLVELIAVVVVASFTVTPALGSISSIPLTEGFWFISGPYSPHESGNTTYSVLVYGVTFAFMYYVIPEALDVPSPVHFEVIFGDSSSEELVFHFGGGFGEPRITLSSHTGPRAAIFRPAAYSPEAHYVWYLAVEI